MLNKPLNYEAERDGSIETRELPFVIGVLANFSGMPSEPLPRLRDRRFIDSTLGNFDTVLAAHRPHLMMKVANRLLPDDEGVPLGVDLYFRSLADFEPEALARQCYPLRKLLEDRQLLADLLARLTFDTEAEEILWRQLAEPGAQDWTNDADLDDLVNRLRWKDDPWLDWDGERSRSCLRTLLALASRGSLEIGRDTRAILRHAMQAIDTLVREQTGEIRRAPDFQKLEATWFGLHQILTRLPQDKVRVRILNVGKRELLRDLQRAPSPLESAVFRHLNLEFGALGGQPFSVIAAAYDFGPTPDDVELLEHVSQAMAAAHCPFLAAASPQMFQLESFSRLDSPRELAPILESSPYAKWRAFQHSDEARYVALVLPRVLVRHSESHDVWGNPSLVLAAQLARSNVENGWPAPLLGPAGGGLVTDLPSCARAAPEGDRIRVGPAEVSIGDWRQTELASLGFIALSNRAGTCDAAFFSTPSCYQPPARRGPAAHELRLTGALECVLLASRFAHYLKCMVRDKVGHYQTRETWESWLNQWISRYSDGRPLSAARVELAGSLRHPLVVAWLTPSPQFFPESAALRIVVSLPQMEGTRL